MNLLANRYSSALYYDSHFVIHAALLPGDHLRYCSDYGDHTFSMYIELCYYLDMCHTSEASALRSCTRVSTVTNLSKCVTNYSRVIKNSCLELHIVAVS